MFLQPPRPHCCSRIQMSLVNLDLTSSFFPPFPPTPFSVSSPCQALTRNTLQAKSKKQKAKSHISFCNNSTPHISTSKPPQQATHQTIHDPTVPETRLLPVRVVRISGTRPLPDYPLVNKCQVQDLTVSMLSDLEIHHIPYVSNEGTGDNDMQSSSSGQAFRMVWSSSNISPIRRGFARHPFVLFFPPKNRRFAACSRVNNNAKPPQCPLRRTGREN